MGLIVRERVGLVGRVTLMVCDALGRIVEERVQPNLICNAGLAQLTAATVWAMAADQNEAMGSPLTAQVLYPMYGVVGSSSTAATAADTQLGTEIERTVVAEATSSGGQLLLTFFFGTSETDWAITECGVFVSGSELASATADSGLLLNHAVFAAVAKTTVQTATLQASFTF